MVALDASLASLGFDMTDDGLVNFSSSTTASASEFDWMSTSGNLIETFSTTSDYTYNPVTVPSGGTTTSIDVDLTGNASIDIAITGISAPLTELVSSADEFWAALLAGDDIITAPANFAVTMFGDFLSVAASAEVTAGSDTFNGSSLADQSFFGDAATNAGTLTGGHDIMNDIGDLSVGDVDDNSGILFGGNDQMMLANGAKLADGDAGVNRTGGTVTGGDDTITVNITSPTDGADITGDVFSAESGSTTHGGNDTIHGGAGPDLLHGDVDSAGGTVTGGDDIIHGNDGDDTLTGDVNTLLASGIVVGGNDQLFGGAGNDTLYGDLAIDEGGTFTSGGNDLLDGGAGIDAAVYGDGGIVVDLSLAGAQTTGEGDDTLSGIENIFSGSGADELTGNAAGNLLSGGGGADRLVGAAGFDVLDGGDGGDRLFGDGGKDVLTGGTGFDWLYGGDWNDTLNGGGGKDKLFGGNGNDLLLGGDWNDVLNGDAGNDSLFGDNGNDLLDGGTDNDQLSGDAGNDTLYGRGGHDTLTGGTQGDQLFGGGGKDTLAGNAGNDQLFGGSFDDTLYGGAGNDQLNGEAGKDWLIGGGGGDILNGGDWNDRLSGGAWHDTLTGGAGNDVFVFTAGQDIITDFGQGVDVIELTSFGFTSFADVQAITAQSGTDLIIEPVGPYKLTIENFALADFDADDVII